LFLYSSTGANLQVQFDQEKAIPFPRRALRVGKFTQAIFSLTPGSTGVTKAIIVYGKGDPPVFPSLDDAGALLISETAAFSNIAAGGVVVLNGAMYPLNAVWISVPAAAANGVWFNEVGGALQGIFVQPGQSTRVPVSFVQGNLNVYNSGGGAVQIGIAYEVGT
ncbi:MAG TPA: hypothetical protein VHU87_14545, partial [Rhizomicrobium sp.]|nr:hypothetical protein [Rhizomicrobium sp.]